MKKNNWLFKFIKGSRGNTVVEFAIVMPMLILVLSGIFELCMYSLINNKLIRIAGSISNITAMQNINVKTLQAIMKTAPQMAQPIPFSGIGAVVVSLIYNQGKTADPANMGISWQQSTSASVSSNFGKPGAKPTNLPNGIQVLNDETLIITEVFYNYVPFVFTGIIPNQTLYKVAVYVPRQGDMVTLVTP
jgi:hypothetical protein